MNVHTNAKTVIEAHKGHINSKTTTSIFIKNLIGPLDCMESQIPRKADCTQECPIYL